MSDLTPFENNFTTPQPQQNPKKRFNPWSPLIYALLLIVGIFLGFQFSNNSSAKLFLKQNNTFTKINEVLNYVEEAYVDTISKSSLSELALNAIIQQLDPHSAYIPAAEIAEMNEPLQGNFEGIGIEFNLLNDTIIVVSALSGGPSEAVGIRAGDRIVKVENKIVAGIKIKNNDVLKMLRGQGGTKVKVAVVRNGNRSPIDFTITRGKIPIYSLDAAYMATANIGYIKISRFAATTYDEYVDAFNKLKAKGMQKLILDLRGNPGGFLNAAISLSDEFLSKNKMIVYTQGKARPKENYFATEKGGFEKQDLVVLIDEGSASASEIVAGAVQDNDRATVVGRRSFGKGLVQEQSDFADGSALRLTIARYYTPTGRSIQKPYKNGEAEDYYSEEQSRFSHGELQHEDSIKFADSLKYKTPKGKIVYGGGGIMPDVFVPIDTNGRSFYLTELFYTGLIQQFALTYADKQREKLKKYVSFDNFNSTFKVTDVLLEDLFAFAEKNKVKRNAREAQQSKALISLYLKANIARNIWRNEGYYPVVNSNDKAFQKAVEILNTPKNAL
ncbi:MAG: S41 family peptidase [Bacteroidota bacterium]